MYLHTHFSLCFIGFNLASSWLGEQTRMMPDHGEFLTPTFNYDKHFSITNQPQTATVDTKEAANQGKTLDYKIIANKL